MQPTHASLITIHVNGHARSVAANAMLASVLDTMSLRGRRFAVECNGEIVPKSALDTTPIHANDRLEIVVAVGGG